MDKIIVDTSAIIAFFVGSEKHHQAARQFVEKNKTTRWIILESVFDECVTWFRAKVSISASIEIGRILRSEHIFVNISDANDKATWEAFQKFDDKFWSYTDCSLLVMSRELGIYEIFAFDEHIRQMRSVGIHCIPVG